MFEHVVIDEYADLDSPIHNWDPRVKLISILCLIFSVVLLNDLKLASIGLTFALLLVLLSKIPLRFVLGQLEGVAVFVSLFFLIMPFTVPGGEIARLGALSVSYEGVAYACLISLRAFTAVLLIFPMLGTMKFDQLVKALDKLKVPNKLVQMFMFTYRYIFVFAEEIAKTLTSLELRGFRMRMNLYTMRTIGNSTGMLFVRSWERSQQVYNAMVSRGYSGTLRTLSEFKVDGKDLLKAFPIMVVAVALHVTAFIGAV